MGPASAATVTAPSSMLADGDVRLAGKILRNLDLTGHIGQ
jgi:hypothetical protein